VVRFPKKLLRKTVLLSGSVIPELPYGEKIGFNYEKSEQKILL